LNCKLGVAIISDEEQLLLLFQYVWLSIGAKENPRGPGRLKVERVVVGQRQKERSSGF
jgi:hypothetical protein